MARIKVVDKTGEQGQHRDTLRRMNTVRLTILALIGCAASSFGGEIYGTIKEGDRPVGKGVQLEIKTGAQVYSTTTDEFGNYRVIVVETGKGALTVQFRG